VINLSIGNATGLALFEINCGYMPTMMEVTLNKKILPGIRTFTMNALRNMTLVHEVLIKSRVFQLKIKVDNLMYLLTRNIAMPMGRASKLVPKFVWLYRVMRVMPAMSAELAKRQIHPRFHGGLLKPYDFSTPEDAEWYIDEIIGHQWRAWAIEFLVKWNMGDSTWEPQVTAKCIVMNLLCWMII
jgi:hypothetical protein